MVPFRVDDHILFLKGPCPKNEWNEHLNEMKGDVRMPQHEKGRQQDDSTNIPSPIPTALFQVLKFAILRSNLPYNGRIWSLLQQKRRNS